MKEGLDRTSLANHRVAMFLKPELLPYAFTETSTERMHQFYNPY